MIESPSQLLTCGNRRRASQAPACARYSIIGRFSVKLTSRSASMMVWSCSSSMCLKGGL